MTGAHTVRGAAVARHLASVLPNERLLLIAGEDAAEWEPAIAAGPAAVILRRRRPPSWPRS
ncbi:hypothetical protein Srubr_18790 [Streptomyces rubradiris]|uniref:Uncharacterized protein n=1 Tax=Streptomyces rubradiris TaxID=285531 RepID=A0ABQ3R870_STRRR|nr:hypothetical protein [Streptomyces rubradiris]GHI52033.1 hypothetical protein Srubr_18790 [Streptomyces rubradiris]